MPQMDEDRWVAKRVEGSITVDELDADRDFVEATYYGNDAPAIRTLFAERPAVVAVLLRDEAGMVYEITR